MLACMETIKTEPGADLVSLVARLRAAVVDLIGQADRANDALVAAGITNLFGEDLEDALRDALEDIDVLLDLDCDPDIYLYWWERVHMQGHLDEIREALAPADWTRFTGVHERFEARFPELASEIARMAARHARTLTYDERLERRAFRALDLMAEGAA